MTALFDSEAFAQIPGQLALEQPPELHGVRWGTMGRRKFHLAPRDGWPVCGHRFEETPDGRGNSWLAPEYVEQMTAAGMICKRCADA